MISIKGIIVPAVIAYSLYYTFTHYDIAPFPPMDNTVEAAIKTSQPQYQNYVLTVTKDCARTQGGLTDGIFTCQVSFSHTNNTGEKMDFFEQKVNIAKRKGKWVVVSMGQRLEQQ